MGHRCKVGAAWWNPVRVRTCADTSGQRQSQYSQSNFFPHDPPPLLDAPERHFHGRTGWHDHKTNSPHLPPHRPNFRHIYANTFSTHPQWSRKKARSGPRSPSLGSSFRVQGSGFSSGVRVRSKKPGNSKCSTLNPEICGATARGGTGRDIPRWPRGSSAGHPKHMLFHEGTFPPLASNGSHQ